MSKEDSNLDSPSGSVVLKRGRLKPVYAGHPWIFSGAIKSVQGEPEAGAPVWVLNPDGARIGWGFYSPTSALRVRFWGFETKNNNAIFSAIFRQRVKTAFARRKALGIPNQETNGYRLLHGEGDLVPGCTADVLGDSVSIRYGSIALWQRRSFIADVVREETQAKYIAQLVDPQVADEEGIYGINHVVNEPDMDRCLVTFLESGIGYETDLLNAQKTGHYTDQRDNRLKIRALSKGKRVLDLCTNTGGFALNAAAGGAESVVAVDSSAPAILRARRNAKENNLQNISFVHEDIMRVMSDQDNESFGLVILDPPKLIKSRRHMEQGEKKYQSLNARAMQMVRAGGLFVSFSCSGVFDETRFLRMLSRAAESAGSRLHVHSTMSVGIDHPFMVQAPESNYLKGILGSVVPR